MILQDRQFKKHITKVYRRYSQKKIMNFNCIQQSKTLRFVLMKKCLRGLEIVGEIIHGLRPHSFIIWVLLK